MKLRSDFALGGYEMTAKRVQRTLSQGRIASLLLAAAFVLMFTAHLAAQNEAVIYPFAFLVSPTDGLVADEAGNLYGLGVVYGGAFVFQLNAHTGAGQPWAFSDIANLPRGYPNHPFPTGMSIDKAGNLYGTVDNGGIFFGSVFQVRPPVTQGGSWTEQTIYAFQTANDGLFPHSGVITDQNGNLYGVTMRGGETKGGTVYELSPPAANGGTWTKTTLYSFTSTAGKRDYVGGCTPIGHLAHGPNGSLFGVASGCGLYGKGTIFQLIPPSNGLGPWHENVLHAFGGPGDGATPLAGVVVGKGGYLYGATNQGGANGFGIVFQLVPPALKGAGWQENILLNFDGDNGCCSDSPLTLAPDGTLYGATNSTGAGVVYKLDPPTTSGLPWTDTVLYRFTGTDDGGQPRGGVLLLGGALYGNAGGGVNLSGVVYVVTF